MDYRKRGAKDVAEEGTDFALCASGLPFLLDGRPVHGHRALWGRETAERMLGKEGEIVARDRHCDALLVADAVEEEFLHVVGNRRAQVRPDGDRYEQMLEKLFFEQIGLVVLSGHVDGIEHVGDKPPGASVETVVPEDLDVAKREGKHLLGDVLRLHDLCHRLVASVEQVDDDDLPFGQFQEGGMNRLPARQGALERLGDTLKACGHWGLLAA